MLTELVIDKTKQRLALWAISLGYFMVIIDVTIVNVALPDIAKMLGHNLKHLQWVIDGYTLTFASWLLSAGNLGDRLGIKRIFVSGLWLFLLSSLVCGLATTFAWLIGARLLQGFAAALMVPTSLSLISKLYVHPTERARAIGVWAGIAGVAAASGPVLGALLTTGFNWRAVFFVNLPIGIFGWILVERYIPVILKHPKVLLDWPGQITSLISLTALAITLIEINYLSWLSPLIVTSLIVFIVALTAFIWFERRSPAPMLPLKFFLLPSFSSMMLLALIINACLFGELFIFPFYFHQQLGYSILWTGLAILPLVGFSGFASYFSGRVVSLLGPRIPIIVGLIIGALGFWSFIWVTSYHPVYLWFILPLAGMGFSAAFTVPAMTIVALNAVPVDRVGIASGMLNASRQIGSLIGVAILGGWINHADQFISGMHTTLWLCGGLCMVLVLVARWGIKK